MQECCETCRNNLQLERWDYTKPNVPKEEMDGYVCLAFASEGLAVQMIGSDPETGRCEMFSQK